MKNEKSKDGRVRRGQEVSKERHIYNILKVQASMLARSAQIIVI